MLCFKIYGKHNNTSAFGVYRNTNSNDAIFDCLLESMCRIQSIEGKALIVICGGVNVHHHEWSSSSTDCHGRSAISFSMTSGCDQLVKEPLHMFGVLDLVFTDTPAIVAARI